jgi:hypothetical protein
LPNSEPSDTPGVDSSSGTFDFVLELIDQVIEGVTDDDDPAGSSHRAASVCAAIGGDQRDAGADMEPDQTEGSERRLAVRYDCAICFSTVRHRGQPQADLSAGLATPQGATGQVVSAAGHLPISATNFVPAVAGHPALLQYLASPALTPQARALPRQSLQHTLRDIDAPGPLPGGRNNLATSVAIAILMATQVAQNAAISATTQAQSVYQINDRLATSLRFAVLPALQNQTLSDTLIYHVAVLRS